MSINLPVVAGRCRNVSIRQSIHKLIWIFHFATVAVLGQSASTGGNAEALAESSQHIVVGSIKSAAMVVRKDRIFKSNDSSNRQASLKFEMGTEYEIVVSRWLKGSKVKKPASIRIFVPSPIEESGLDLLIGKTYLILLKKATFDRGLEKKLIVVRSNKGIEVPENRFYAKEYFEIVGGRTGLLKDAERINSFTAWYLKRH